jgi:hypothetical protein
VEKKSLHVIHSSDKGKLSKNLHIRIIGNENGRLELAVIVNENTSLDEIEKQWNFIKTQANGILQLQGTDATDYYYGTRLQLAELHVAEGFSYSELAVYVNYNTFCDLLIVLESLRSGDITNAANIVESIRLRFEGLGIKFEDFKEWINQSLHELENEKAPWSLNDGPADKQNMVDFIRQFKREYEKGKIVIPKFPREHDLTEDELMNVISNNKPIWNKAEMLLKQMPNSGGLKTLDKFNKRNQIDLKG